MKISWGAALFMASVFTLVLFVLYATVHPFGIESCDPPPWPEGWPEPHTTVQHTTGWVCQYGESLPGERYGWTVCMRWTQAQGCEIFQGANVRGDRL